MRIIEITSLSNGGHRNQTGTLKNIPTGYAVIPDDLETLNFPFGDVEVTEINGVPTVIKWVAGTTPEIEEKEQPVSEVEQLRADVDYIAVMTGVEL